MTKKAPAAGAAVDRSAGISTRVHVDLVRRLDALIPALASSSLLSPTGKADRSDVIRAALDIGVAALESATAEGLPDAVRTRRAASFLAESVLDTLARDLKNEDWRARQAAAVAILDRAFGKPEQPIKIQPKRSKTRK